MSTHRAFGKTVSELDVAVAGDRRTLFSVLQPVLHGIGVRTIRGFDNASQAVAGLTEAPADVVFMADSLEPIDGYLLCEMLRRRKSGPVCEAAIVIMAGGPVRQRDLERALLAGAHQVLMPPISPALLSRRLMALCQDARLFRTVDGWMELEGTRDMLSRVRMHELLGAGDVVTLPAEAIRTDDGPPAGER